MKKYQDNFNLYPGYTKEITEYIRLGKRSIKKVEIYNKSIKSKYIEYHYWVDTSDAKYPSLACLMGAQSCSFVSNKFLPIFWMFLKNIL